MKQAIINSQELSQFVTKNNLRNKHSIIHFNSIVNIKTAKNKIDFKEMEVMISFDGFDNYGKVTLMDDELDPYLYPTEFNAKWQKMEIDVSILKISGFHKDNVDIGNYEVKIIPKDRLRE